MNIIETALPGVLIIEPKVFGDARGYFFESWNQAAYEAAGITNTWVQDNESKSCHGVLRGLHYQAAPYTQAKIVRAFVGTVLDVVVDIRKGSPSYGKHIAVELSGENKRQLYIPRGFAHGFVVLSDEAVSPTSATTSTCRPPNAASCSTTPTSASTGASPRISSCFPTRTKNIPRSPTSPRGRKRDEAPDYRRKEHARRAQEMSNPF